ncbi:MAG: FAD-dependent oxidoreductase [Myxococcota bacterium]|nr:FAD-dependent oxidoreductase [Myxococcota bacterium]
MSEPHRHLPRPASEIGRWDDVADVVVVGHGCAGACAAIEAARAGADVLVLERAGGGGGTSANSGGLLYLGGGTPLQKALGFDDHPDEMFRYLMAACGPDPDEDLVRPYCEHSVEHFHWLVDCGWPLKEAFFPDAHEPPGDESLTYSGSETCWPFRDIAKPAPRGHCGSVVGPKGALLMQTLSGAAGRAGARVRTGARVERLVIEGDGSVAGVVGCSGREAWSVRARRGVVLTSGGFIYNRSMVERYAPLLGRCLFKVGTEHDDGSGIQMAAAVGAATLRMDAGDVTLPLFPPVVLKQGVLVNRLGQRVLNEDSYMGRLGEFALLHNDGRVWLIVDDAGFAQPANAPAQSLCVGESWAELEAEVGFPEGALQDTMDYYNRHASRGRDPLFHKQDPHLRPLDQPPYGALDLSVDKVIYAVFTLGGLWIGADGAVRTPAGDVVPGLYAAGRTTSGIAKQGYSSGLSLGDASFFGRRAGRTAARGRS